MKTLKRTAEELQLKCDFLQNAVDSNAKVIVEFAEENDRLRKELAYKDELLQSVLEDLDDACNEVVKLEDRCENMVQEINDLSDEIADLEGEVAFLNCELAEAKTDAYTDNAAIKHIVNSLKADGIIPQDVDTDSERRLNHFNRVIDHLESY